MLVDKRWHTEIENDTKNYSAFFSFFYFFFFFLDDTFYGIRTVRRRYNNISYVIRTGRCTRFIHVLLRPFTDREYYSGNGPTRSTDLFHATPTTTKRSPSNPTRTLNNNNKMSLAHFTYTRYPSANNTMLLVVRHTIFH